METKLNGLTLKILPDEDPVHPREDCDHFGTIMSWHRNYDFNDANNDYDTPRDFWESEKAKNIYAYLPVYLLDHSGLRLSTGRFACDPDGWDSGQIGFIYCSETEAKAWLGEDCTPERTKAELYREIQAYDGFLSNEFYYFLIEGKDGEFLDSCGSFEGGSDIIARMKEYADEDYHPLFDKLALKLQNNVAM